VAGASPGDVLVSSGAPVALPRGLPRKHALEAAGEGGTHAAVAALLGLAVAPAAVVALVAPNPAHATPLVAAPAPRAADTAHAVLFADAGDVATQQDPRTQELVGKVGRLVSRSFQGDTRAAFNHYAGSDGQVDRLELSRLLEDAGIGSGFTRAFWVDGIMERVDQAPTGNGNGKISWPEFSRVISGGIG
jgi:hypothetical protein